MHNINDTKKMYTTFSRMSFLKQNLACTLYKVHHAFTISEQVKHNLTLRLETGFIKMKLFGSNVKCIQQPSNHKQIMQYQCNEYCLKYQMKC
ncbi:unnamed protein product [Paramecium octaurelia]|uniref:Uncharacterized protein n=1 Tax=Paramecium octaurelia TaxID=43137 RepID=A0A8S1WQT8_PAROT|nr:unnamed protein product [Paramecium octaurelia]